MATYGSLKRFYDMIRTAPSMAGVSVAFGEETIAANEYPTPRLTIVPLGGNWGENNNTPGYERDSDPNLQNLWMTGEVVELHCWAIADGQLPKPVDHADAVENLRALTLQALQSQRARYASDNATKERGLTFRVISGRWALANNVTIREGRCYVLTIQIDITVPSALPAEATIEHITLDPIAIGV